MILKFTALALLLAASVQAKPLVVCTEASPEGFDGAMFTAAATNDAAGEALYNRLVQFEPGTTKVIPGLAQRWEISKDGLQYTFFLRQGVKFHSTDWFKPTRTLNADDVLWSFGRMLDPQHPGAKASLQGWPYAADMGFPELIQKLEKLDQNTVRFTLKHPEGPFLADLGMGFTSIVSAEYAQKLAKEGRDKDIGTQPIGTGPFKLKRYDKGAQVRYEAHPDYWRGKAASDKLIFAIADDGAVRTQKLLRGECQFMLYPKPGDKTALRADPKIALLESPALLLSYLALNSQRPQLKDKRVRQALALAIDKQAIIKAVYDGAASSAHLPMPMTIDGYAKSIPAYAPDLARAKKLMAEAGQGQGFDMKIYVRTGGSAGNPNPKLTAEMIQADWAKLGVKAQIVVMEWVEVQKRTKAGEHDAFIYSWAGDNGDADNFLTPNLSCAAFKSGENRSRWCNQAFDKLLAQGRREANPAKRRQIYEQAQQLFIEEMPWVSLVEPKVTVAHQKNVVGYKANPFTNNNFETVKVE